MRPEYYGVKYYGINDFSIGEHLKRAVIIIESFDEHEDYEDVNRVIELYNVQELINSGVCLKEWNEGVMAHYKQLCNPITRILANFFGQINDENFQQICWSVCIGYIEDYWKLFVRFKVFKRISKQKFTDYLNNSKTALWILLQQKELVKYYGKEFADVMRSSKQTPQLIISKYLMKHNQKCLYYFPEELSPLEYEGILINYLKSETANLNYVQLLALAAKKICNSYWERYFSEQTGFGIDVQFAGLPEIKKVERTENGYQVTYDVKWLLTYLDYPTILNNFKYIFEQFDDCWRSSLVSASSQLGIIEKTLLIRGVKDYIMGNRFCIMDRLSTMQVKGYYEILKSKGVLLEEVFEWFFEEYLPKEFNANGFSFTFPSKGRTLVEKIRTIASEMERILKQFCMYVEDKEIDRELFEISSGHIRFSDLPGFIGDKYAYGNSKDIQKVQFLLFSDQSPLNYIEKTQGEYYSIL